MKQKIVYQHVKHAEMFCSAWILGVHGVGIPLVIVVLRVTCLLVLFDVVCLVVVSCVPEDLVTYTSLKKQQCFMNRDYFSKLNQHVCLTQGSET